MGENLPENISSVEMIVNSDEGMKKYKINVHGGNIDTVFTLDKSGDYYFSFEGFSSLPEKIRVIPGWLSIIPPLLAILLALLFRQVILSLFSQIFLP